MSSRCHSQGSNKEDTAGGLAFAGNVQNNSMSYSCDDACREGTKNYESEFLVSRQIQADDKLGLEKNAALNRMKNYTPMNITFATEDTTHSTNTQRSADEPFAPPCAESAASSSILDKTCDFPFMDHEQTEECSQVKEKIVRAQTEENDVVALKSNTSCMELTRQDKIFPVVDTLNTSNEKQPTSEQLIQHSTAAVNASVLEDTNKFPFPQGDYLSSSGQAEISKPRQTKLLHQNAALDLQINVELSSPVHETLLSVDRRKEPPALKSLTPSAASTVAPETHEESCEVASQSEKPFPCLEQTEKCISGTGKTSQARYDEDDRLYMEKDNGLPSLTLSIQEDEQLSDGVATKKSRKQPAEIETVPPYASAVASSDMVEESCELPSTESFAHLDQAEIFSSDPAKSLQAQLDVIQLHASLLHKQITKNLQSMDTDEDRKPSPFENGCKKENNVTFEAEVIGDDRIAWYENQLKALAEQNPN